MIAEAPSQASSNALFSIIMGALCCAVNLIAAPTGPPTAAGQPRPLASPGAMHFYELTEETLPCLLQSGESASVSL